MKHFTIDGIADLIPTAILEQSTGDPWLDARYQEDVPIIGHTNPYYKWFYLIAVIYEPAFTVELGAYRGTGAAHFAAGNPAGQVVTVDVHREDKIAQQKVLEAQMHYPNLTYINGWTVDIGQGGFPIALPQVQAMGKQIDLLYIDAWHEYQYAIQEWRQYSPLLADTALVICDDVFDMAGATVDMVKFWNEISAPYEHKLIADPRFHGYIPMGAFKYER